MITREKLVSEYFDFRNNYLTIEKFAEHRGLTVAEAQMLLDLALCCVNNPHPEAQPCIQSPIPPTWAGLNPKLAGDLQPKPTQQLLPAK